MTHGERIRAVRKMLGLTLEKFGDKIGMKKNSVSQIENGKNAMTDQVAKSICREFNVDYTWLTTGEGHMFLPDDRNSDIARLTKQLLTEENNSFKNRFISMLSNLSVDEWEFLERKAQELYRISDTNNDAAETAEAEYIKSRSASAQNTTSSVLNITDDIEGKAAGQ